LVYKKQLVLELDLIRVPHIGKSVGTPIIVAGLFNQRTCSKNSNEHIGIDLRKPGMFPLPIFFPSPLILPTRTLRLRSHSRPHIFTNVNSSKRLRVAEYVY
jgi:hypothetical protein